MIAYSTTVPAWRMADEPGYWRTWLDALPAAVEGCDAPVVAFAALECDGRGVEPFEPLLDAMDWLPCASDWWTFRVDDGAAEATTANRLMRITMGQNLATRHADVARADHLCFVAADCAAPPGALAAMLEMAHPIVGIDVPTYCLDGPPAPGYPPSWDVREHMASAALVMLERRVFMRVPWRVDGDAGMSDDPCMHHDCAALGWPTHVRHDLHGQHYPECIGPIETRARSRALVDGDRTASGRVR